MSDEFRDLLDSDGHATGATHRRGDPIPEGLKHAVVSVCTVRDDGHLLVTQRAASKTYPLTWELTAGSALAGEIGAQAASRELEEEVGLSRSPNDLRFLDRLIEPTAFFLLYGVTVPTDARVRLDPGEVADSRWVTPAQLDAMARSGELADPWVARLQKFRPAIESYFRDVVEATSASRVPHVRPFRSGDEPALAEICTRTADAGGDATGILADDRLWGELFVLPYVARHPDLAWVVEADDGGVVGYIVGTDDTDAFDRWFRDEWWPQRAPRYDTVGAKQTDLLRSAGDRGRTREPYVAGHPAHLHIDILPEAQGSGFGRLLVNTLLDELARRGAGGLHLGVDPQNAGAAAFYERLGFARLPSRGGSVTYGIQIATRE